MQKEEAVQIVLEARRRGFPEAQIVAELCQRTGAPESAMLAFVRQALAEAQVQAQAARRLNPAPSPPPPEPVEKMASFAAGPSLSMDDEQLVSWTADRLKSGSSLSDVITQFCERTGASWKDAEQFVNEVAYERRKEIGGFKNLILIPIGIGTILGGLLLAVNNSIALYNAYTDLGDPGASYRSITLLLTGLGMIAGGIYGTFQAIKVYWE